MNIMIVAIFSSDIVKITPIRVSVQDAKIESSPVWDISCMAELISDLIISYK